MLRRSCLVSLFFFAFLFPQIWNFAHFEPDPEEEFIVGLDFEGANKDARGARRARRLTRDGHSVPVPMIDRISKDNYWNLPTSNSIMSYFPRLEK